MLSVQNNMLAWNADRQLNINRKKKEKSAEKLSSGYKINRAADDAAGLSISEKMRRQIRGLQKGQENITDGISWVQIGDGAMEEIAQMLHRMEELAVKGANGTLQTADRAAIDEEIKQLRREINEIAKWTTFNDKKIFDNDQIDIDIESSLNELEIFNATYDSTTGEVTYGGFLFRGQRISWDSISPDMVTFDKNTNQQIFTGGSYDYWDKDGYHFHVDCEPGAKVPEISRSAKVEAYEGGISLDGRLIPWGSLYDEDGRSADEICHDGTWYADYEGMKIAYFFPDGSVGSRQDMIDAISTLNTHDSKVRYRLEELYERPSEEKAVDVVKLDQLRLSNHLVKDLMHSENHDQILSDGTTVNPHEVGFMNENGGYSVIVKAAKADPDDSSSKDGIWLEYEYNCKKMVDGKEVVESHRVEAAGSYRSWTDLGLTDWFDGDDVKGGSYQYTYTGDDGDSATMDDTYLSFNFTLSDITSKDSVIDGLDEMRINGGAIQTKYETLVEVDDSEKNILAVNATSRTKVTFQEERALDRDFDDPNAVLPEGKVSYDKATGNILLEFKLDPSQDAMIQYNGSNNQTAKMNKDLEKYAQHVLIEKTALALAGEDPQTPRPEPTRLSDLLGHGNMTMAGYFDQTVTLDSTMKLSNGNGGHASSGVVGRTYPTAMIDFKGLGQGTISLDQLVGSGFNSTCKTCNNHYSIEFVSNGSNQKTANGYGYRFEPDSGNYKLKLDINTFKDAGVDTAAELADAIVDVVSACFDFHYTQYASKDGVLYVYDNREDSQTAPSATFGDWSFSSIEMDSFDFSMRANNGSYVNTSYTYSYADFEDNIVVELKQNLDESGLGEYVKLQDAGGKDYYEKYDETKHGVVDLKDRFDLFVTYKDMEGNEVADLQAARDSYAANAFNKMLSNTTVQHKALDYSMMTVRGNENQNVAIRSIFDSNFSRYTVDNDINIRCSAQDGDRTTIPRFGVNTFSLKLYRVGAKTQEQAEETIQLTKDALVRLNDRRTIYGSMQNRLEHAYNIRKNVEENTQAAESRLRDTDVAKEMIAFSNQNILMQAGISMLTQAKSSSQYALQILQ